MTLFSPVNHLAAVLKDVRRPGDFATGGRLSTPLPDLKVKGVGQVAFPLLASQADVLRAAATQAPYGKGAATLVDESIRRVWQISPSEFTLEGQGFESSLATVVEQARVSLGVSGQVRALPYKLLLYEAGSFFVDHRDSEKVDRMFGTLVVVLPSTFSGGALLVRHAGREVELPLASPSVGEVAWGAFFADCVHEIRPVTEGFRLALIYNLVLDGRAVVPRAPDHHKHLEAATGLFSRWVDTPQSLPRLVWTFEHKYTPAGMSWEGLKNGDAGVAKILREAAAGAGCECWLGVISISESGSAEFQGGYQPRRWSRRSLDDSDPANYSDLEVYDRSELIGDWVDLNGGRPELAKFELNREEVGPAGVLEGAKPDEETFSESTGNEGGSFERAWRYGCIVLWPRRRTGEMLGRENPGTVLSWLAHFTARGTPDEELRQQALALLSVTLDDLSSGKQRLSPGTWGDTSRLAADLFTALLNAKDPALLIRFLTEPTALPSVFAEAHVALVLRAVDELGWANIAPGLMYLIQTRRHQAFAACVQLLYALVSRSDAGGQRERLLALGGALVGGSIARGLDSELYYLGELRDKVHAGQVATVVDLYRALDLIGDATLTQTATLELVTPPRPYRMDEVLVPAAVVLNQRSRHCNSVTPLTAACLAHLDARIALPLEPPGDWSREAIVHCTCGDCTMLASFLADPAAERWLFKAAKERRSHVERKAQAATPDVNYSTIKQGSPHGLLCVKTDATYQRRLKERAADLKTVKVLRT